MEIDLFIPCFIDQIYPDTAWSTIKVLEKAGCKINYNPKQTCCGQPSFNSGYWEETKTLAKKFITDFSGVNPVVSPSASCSGFVRNNYEKIFEGDQTKINESKEIKSRIIELTDFLVNQIQITDLGAVFNHKVTYHDSCSALREYGIKTEPRLLLSKVKGLELIEMEGSDVCCGFGGTFSVKFKGISSAMAQQKVDWAMETGAEYIVGTESSCMLNIQSYIKKHKLPIKTIHIADILASGY